jgi:hypothetical protein
MFLFCAPAYGKQELSDALPQNKNASLKGLAHFVFTVIPLGFEPRTPTLKV